MAPSGAVATNKSRPFTRSERRALPQLEHAHSHGVLQIGDQAGGSGYPQDKAQTTGP